MFDGFDLREHVADVIATLATALVQVVTDGTCRVEWAGRGASVLLSVNGVTLTAERTGEIELLLDAIEAFLRCLAGGCDVRGGL
jgi:hypothetical protein